MEDGKEAAEKGHWITTIWMVVGVTKELEKGTG